MDRQPLLQQLLEDLLDSRNVYFQPPSNVQMQYPCIVYQRDSADTEFADNKTYRFVQRYQVTVIDRAPDNSIIREKIIQLPHCRYDRFYTANNLNHDVFNLYF